MVQRILVVGAYGETGRYATSALANDPALRVIAGGRRMEELERLRRELDGRVEIAQVDFDDVPAMAAQARGCQVVVNMAGPMSRVIDKVALAALEAGAHYVDPGGSAALYARLTPKNAAFQERGLAAVVCAGWIAGLSELLPAALLAETRRRFERIDGFHAICGDNNLWSPTATRDVVEYLRRGDSFRQISLLRRGKRVARNPLTMWRSFDLPEPVGRVRGLCRLTEEFSRVVEGAPYPQVGSYFALTSLSSLLVFARARDPRISMERAIEMLNQARLADQTRFHLNSFVAAQADGFLGNGASRVSQVILCPDHNRATGSAAAVAASHLAKGPAKPGAHYASEAFDAERFVADFSALGFPLIDMQEGARDIVPRVA